MDYMKFVDKVDSYLRSGRFDKARDKVDKARKDQIYNHNDRLLYLLDKGIIEHYTGNYAESNRYLDKAEKTMDELFTRSVSQIALSFVVNDNVTDYWGEVYENIYVNIFKALNYSHLGDLEGALVEIRKVNIKLQELDDKYGSTLKDMAEKQEVELELEENRPFYSDAIGHFLSAQFYLATGERDQAQISLNKLQQAWKTQKHIYNFPLPEMAKADQEIEDQSLTIIAFTGTGPKKRSVGGMITTYEDFIGISDLSVPVALPNIPFPGSEPGYHFKFAFPVIKNEDSRVSEIRIIVDGEEKGMLSLLENMGQVAEHTFESHKHIIYIKTILRTVSKGLAAAEAKKKLKKEADADGILGAFIDFAVDAGVDASERADLRCWNTMPQKCYIGQVPLSGGKHQVQLIFLDRNGDEVDRHRIDNVELNDKINLLEFISLN